MTDLRDVLLERQAGCQHAEVRALTRYFPTSGTAAGIWLYCIRCGQHTQAPMLTNTHLPGVTPDA